MRTPRTLIRDWCTAIGDSWSDLNGRWRSVLDAGGSPKGAGRHTPPATEREVPAWVKRFGDAVVARLTRLSAVILGGMALCLSFPPFGWWYAGIVAFALLAWVLTRDATTLVGGFGYGFLFGAAFNIPLLPWTGVMVGLLPR